MELIPIKEKLEENQIFANDPLCQDSLYMTLDYYRVVGYSPPWIGYYVKKGEQLVGSGAFKGRPLHGKVEIAYGTFERFQHQGIGIEICKELVTLSLKTDPSVKITARTFRETNYSTKILEKNGFTCCGTVIDQDDGEVWEWEYNPTGTTAKT
jgi:[ribosomal protein S5]-alanine N-acetyltransferase